ncbi:MAG: hypothetical protein KVP17_000457 [Porospora cf. gigantea B]|uniref:uncharacterized protein n=1 Tax=Porospora cf. gigantea B TaxID=2853592 RepID=UPI00357194C1|nr:MAG: hypothetical protein KVP17_000457 [Porospora cf. gigantea B]
MVGLWGSRHQSSFRSPPGSEGTSASDASESGRGRLHTKHSSSKSIASESGRGLLHTKHSSSKSITIPDPCPSDPMRFLNSPNSREAEDFSDIDIEMHDLDDWKNGMTVRVEAPNKPGATAGKDRKWANLDLVGAQKKVTHAGSAAVKFVNKKWHLLWRAPSSHQDTPLETTRHPPNPIVVQRAATTKATVVSTGFEQAQELTNDLQLERITHDLLISPRRRSICAMYSPRVTGSPTTRAEGLRSPQVTFSPSSPLSPRPSRYQNTSALMTGPATSRAKLQAYQVTSRGPGNKPEGTGLAKGVRGPTETQTERRETPAAAISWYNFWKKTSGLQTERANSHMLNSNDRSLPRN